MQSIHIGIDGGGTHSTGTAVGADGQILAVCGGGPLNENTIGRKQASENFFSLVHSLLGACGAKGFASLTAGLSSLERTAGPDMVLAYTHPQWEAGDIVLESDALVALMGGTLGDPGLAVIAGTGSMCLLLDRQGRQHTAGGLGFALGDPGSGYSIARDALRYALLHDRNSPILKEAFSYFGAGDTDELMQKIYASPFSPSRIAGFARCVIGLSGEGDHGAAGILGKNMRALAAQANGLLQRFSDVRDVFLYGSMFRQCQENCDTFKDALSGPFSVRFPEFPPETGAALMGLKRCGQLNHDCLTRLSSCLHTFYPDA